MNSCAICNAPSTKQCAACLAVFYCSKDHQKQDWKIHKTNTCLPYKMKDDESLGPHLVDARQIATGELILKENPLVRRAGSVHGTVSHLEQSCFANCYKVTISREIIVRAAQPIKPGEHLSLCYINPLVGTRERLHLLKGFMSTCICTRCLDPTELGTHFSSLKCQITGCSGLIVPPDAHRLNNLPWQCQSCNEKTSALNVGKLISTVRDALSSVDKSSFFECHLFINFFETYLHENHYLLTEVRLAATQTPDSSNLTEDDWKVQLKYCRQLDQLLSRIARAKNKIRGFILFRTSTALFNIDGDDNVEDAKYVAVKAYELLKHEPDVPGNILDALRLGRKVPMPAAAKAFEQLKREQVVQGIILGVQQMLF